jgi:hypothetical protein
MTGKLRNSSTADFTNSNHKKPYYQAFSSRRRWHEVPDEVFLEMYPSYSMMSF